MTPPAPLEELEASRRNVIPAYRTAACFEHDAAGIWVPYEVAAALIRQQQAVIATLTAERDHAKHLLDTLLAGIQIACELARSVQPNKLMEEACLEATSRMVAMRKERDDLAALIRQQQAVIDRLPKSADGVPLAPGMLVWEADGSNLTEADGTPYEGFKVLTVGREYQCVRQRKQWVVLDGLGEVTTDRFYSTREAALAAIARERQNIYGRA